MKSDKTKKSTKANSQNDEKLEIQQLKIAVENAQSAQIRALADLENYKRREAENKKNWSKFAVSEFLKPFLPNLLELNLGVSHAQDKSLKKVMEKFMNSLDSQGLKKIEPKNGDPIDPELHAVLMAEDGTPGTVVRTLEIGWQYQDTIIIPAKVSGAS